MKTHDFLSNSFLLTGSEAPINKLMKSSQIHSDCRVSPLRFSGSLLATGILPRVGSNSPAVRTQNMKLDHLGMPKAHPSLTPTPSTIVSASTTTKSAKSYTGFNAKLSQTKSNFLSTSVLRGDLAHSDSQKRMDISVESSEDLVRFAQSRLDKSSSNAAELHFVPYTLKDYRNIQRQTTKRLGGLGPVHIGTQEWREKMDKKKKMIEFSQKVTLPKLILAGDRSKSVPKVKTVFG